MIVDETKLCEGSEAQSAICCVYGVNSSTDQGKLKDKATWTLL